MTCTFAKDFIAQHAKAFFQDEGLRLELTKHLLDCPDCQRHIAAGAQTLFEKIGRADPQQMMPILQDVIGVAEDDMAKWKEDSPYAKGKRAGENWPQDTGHRPPTHDDCPFPKDSQQATDYWDGFRIGYLEVASKKGEDDMAKWRADSK